MSSVAPIAIHRSPINNHSSNQQSPNQQLTATSGTMAAMPYPEPFIAPMRAELASVGARELRTPEDVDAALREQGTVMIVVNSVCGCAAGKARPGIAIALQHAKRPDFVGTVFAGADLDATARAREAFAPYPPSSPSVGSLRDGKLVPMLERRHIEMRDARSIASMLTAAFDEHC